MSKVNNETALREIEDARVRLIAVINQGMDAIKQMVITGEPCSAVLPSEIRFPLYSNPALFKGEKPTAVLFQDERVEVKTWRKVFTEILTRCCADPQTHEALMSLRNKVSGRKRKIISDKPDGMDFPIMLSEGLYIEADYDTELLISILTRHILTPAGYDYNGISVMVKTKGGDS